MFSEKKLTLVVAYLLILLVYPVAATAESLNELRDKFLQAEQYIVKKNDKEYFKLAKQLKDYPLYPYLQYQWLSKHLQKSRTVQNFILKYRSTRYAGLLKNKWLRYLAKNKDWTQLIKHYRSSSSAELQ